MRASGFAGLVKKKKKCPIGATAARDTHLPPAPIPSRAFSQVRVERDSENSQASIGAREGGVFYKGSANLCGRSQKGVQ